MQTQTSQNAQRAYQLRLAQSLVESCGFDDAIYFCQNNQWAGVLQAIQMLYGHSARH